MTQARPTFRFPHRAGDRVPVGLGIALSIAALALLLAVPFPPGAATAAVEPGNVAAGKGHSCAIRSDGTLACWGDDSAGQLDDIPSGEFRALSAGGAHTCAIRSDGTLACWGDDSAGQ